MKKTYFEIRKQVMRNSLATDIMRHLHTRQHLGKAVIVCEHPSVMLSATRKQWLKLSRNVQNQRAATLNADKILKYTHAVTHMQHMRFTAKLPWDDPEADVYFLRPDMLETIPLHCLSLYLTAKLSSIQVEGVLNQLSPGALVIDYDQSINWSGRGLEPKEVLETQVEEAWQQVEQFLTTYRIDIQSLAGENVRSIEAMEEALDILLGASPKYMQIAGDFQHALELARPLRLSKVIRQRYDAAILLAHRVQALTPGAFTRRFLETYNEDDTFFLYDFARGRIHPLTGESLAEAIARHIRAGRHRLAAALKRQYLSKTVSQ